MRAILICPNESLKLKFTSTVGRDQTVVLSKILDTYPSSEQLRQVLCSYAPEIVFLDIENLEASAEIASHLEKDFLLFHSTELRFTDCRMPLFSGESSDCG